MAEPLIFRAIRKGIEEKVKDKKKAEEMFYSICNSMMTDYYIPELVKRDLMDKETAEEHKKMIEEKKDEP